MRVSTMIRTASAGFAIAAIAACSDAPVMPHQAQDAAMQPSAELSAAHGGFEARARSAATKFADKGQAFDSAVVTIDPRSAHVLVFGLHKIAMPAHAICDLNSSYGQGTWDTPCTPATGEITISAVWSTRRGHAYIEFEPALRFSPSATVLLTLSDNISIKSPNYAILWRDPMGMWVDESLSDPTLKTWVSGITATRRIKHFSGYNVSAGDGCDPMSDPTCILQ